MPPHTSHLLETGWQLKYTRDGGEDEWLSVRRVPTNVHLDLIDNRMLVFRQEMTRLCWNP